MWTAQANAKYSWAMDLKNLSLISTAIKDQHKNFVIANVNDHCMRLAVMDEKTYPWHTHPDSDELFLILEGELVIEFNDEPSVRLNSGDFHKVPAGKVHRTIAVGRTVNLCFESTVAETVFVELI
jgi:mannose-6-phosphate isomerase-like protein (cupin superfamily)